MFSGDALESQPRRSSFNWEALRWPNDREGFLSNDEETPNSCRSALTSNNEETPYSSRSSLPSLLPRVKVPMRYLRVFEKDSFWSDREGIFLTFRVPLRFIVIGLDWIRLDWYCFILHLFAFLWDLTARRCNFTLKQKKSCWFFPD